MGSDNRTGALKFSSFCRTFLSGGTRIRTGDTMIFSHLQKPLGMQKTRIGKRIYVQGVPSDTMWFCPYCCATVDTAFVALRDIGSGTRTLFHLQRRSYRLNQHSAPAAPEEVSQILGRDRPKRTALRSHLAWPGPNTYELRTDSGSCQLGISLEIRSLEKPGKGDVAYSCD
jgi:hypothetical protein